MRATKERHIEELGTGERVVLVTTTYHCSVCGVFVRSDTTETPAGESAAGQ